MHIPTTGSAGPQRRGLSLLTFLFGTSARAATFVQRFDPYPFLLIFLHLLLQPKIQRRIDFSAHSCYNERSIKKKRG